MNRVLQEEEPIPEIGLDTEAFKLEQQRQRWVALTGPELIESAIKNKPLLAFGQMLVNAAESEKRKNQTGPASALLDIVLRDQLTRMLVEASGESVEAMLTKKMIAKTLPKSGPLSIDAGSIDKAPWQLPDNAVRHFLDQHTAFTTILTMAVAPLTYFFTNGGLFAAGGATAIATEGVRALKQTGEVSKTAKDIISVAWAMHEKEDGSRPHLEDFKRRLYVVSTVKFPDVPSLDKHIGDSTLWEMRPRRAMKR